MSGNISKYKHFFRLLVTNIVARMTKNKPIDGSTLERICAALQCQPADVIEYVPDEGK